MAFLKAAKFTPWISLALGTNIHTFGLEMTSKLNLFPLFSGPFAAFQCRPQDIEFLVPEVYQTNSEI